MLFVYLFLHEHLFLVFIDITYYDSYIKVKELRARQYAAQDELMHHLFSQIVSLMDMQYANILQVVVQYAAIAKELNAEYNERLQEILQGNNNTTRNNNNYNRSRDKEVNCSSRKFSTSNTMNMVINKKKTPAEENLDKERNKQLIRLEEQLKDMLISLEDWLFYLQDLFSLKIMTLRRALVHHIMTEFLYPIVLDPLLKPILWSQATCYRSLNSSIPGFIPFDDPIIENKNNILSTNSREQNQSSSLQTPAKSSITISMGVNPVVTTEPEPATPLSSPALTASLSHKSESQYSTRTTASHDEQECEESAMALVGTMGYLSLGSY